VEGYGYIPPHPFSYQQKSLLNHLIGFSARMSDYLEPAKSLQVYSLVRIQLSTGGGCSQEA